MDWLLAALAVDYLKRTSPDAAPAHTSKWLRPALIFVGALLVCGVLFVGLAYFAQFMSALFGAMR